MTCNGGNMKACECMMGCDVFGGDKQQCHGSTDLKQVIDQAVSTTLQRPGNECDGMKCVVKCGHELHCLDDAVKLECQTVVNHTRTCEVDCTGRDNSNALQNVAPSLLIGALCALGLLGG